MTNPQQPKKLVILGGGVGAMAAAFEITSAPNWQQIYESITVYQLGWRIGGKGASGRRAPSQRIEEHGLHIWIGFYNNAFDVMQRAYGELNRPPGAPLATWQDAFKQHSYIVLAQEFKNNWYPWAFNFPTNDSVPGIGDPMPTLWDYICMTIKWIKELFVNSDFQSHAETAAQLPQHRTAVQWFKDFVEQQGMQITVGSATLAEELLNAATLHLDRLDPDATKHNASDHSSLINLLDEVMNWMRREFAKLADDDLEIRRFFILMDIATTGIMGLLQDGVLFHPQQLESLDDEDLRGWLARHGALPVTTDSPLMKGLYDLVFAYENGEVDKPSFAAGTAIRCIFRICFTYKGAIFWKMQAGMGDTVFTPIYQVLKKRGVNFKFFHKVENLGLSDDKASVATIKLGRQATVKGGGEYDPLVDVLGLPCWPSVPNYDQLVEGEELQEKNINLESFYTPWECVEDITLQAGKDFDDVVFGISLGSIPYLCSELIAANPQWSAMVENMQTVRTMAFQTWANKDLKELGWDDQSAVMDGYVDPLNTWADMTYLNIRENWPASDNIRNISYFCGQMEGGIPPPEDHDTPEIAKDIVEQAAHEYLEKNVNQWWPKDIDPATGGFDWNSIVSIYHRANIDPSERYVLSVKNSTWYRLDGANSGFSNLYLAGDWTVNGINAGCVEAATISGMIVSSALVGNPSKETIEGLNDI